MRWLGLGLLCAVACNDEPLRSRLVPAAGGSVGVIPSTGGSAGAGAGAGGNPGGSAGLAGSDAGSSMQIATGGPFVTMLAAGADGTIYFGSWDKKLYAVAPDGALRWTFATNGRIDAPPAVLDDRVIFVSWDGSVYCVDLDGAPLWSFASGAPIDVAPAIGSDGTVFVANDAGALFALDASGQALAETTMPAPPTTDIVLDGEGAELLLRIGTSGARLLLLNSALEQTAEALFSSGDPVQSIALGADGTAFVGTSGGELAAVTRTGEIAWTADLTYAPVFPPAIGFDGTLFAGATDRVLYVVSAEGVVERSTSLPGAVLSAPVVTAGETLVIGARHLLLATLSGVTTTLAELDIGHAPVFAESGRVFVGTHEGQVWGLETGLELGLGDTAWPSERGGFRRLGRRSP